MLSSIDDFENEIWKKVFVWKSFCLLNSNEICKNHSHSEGNAQGKDKTREKNSEHIHEQTERNEGCPLSSGNITAVSIHLKSSEQTAKGLVTLIWQCL